MGGHSKIWGKQQDNRDTLFNKNEPFGALFHCVYLTERFRIASMKAKVLLFDLIYQYRGANNGRLVLCPNEKDRNDGFTLRERTKLSEPSIYRGAAELEVLGLIVCTRRGDFARRTSWYGLTWAPIDRANEEYEIKTSFESPLRWWKNGPPDWQNKRLQTVSEYHKSALKKHAVL